MSERNLAQLLHDVTPAPPVTVDIEQVVAAARRRRRTTVAGVVAGMLVLAGAAAAVPTVLGGDRDQRLVPAVTPGGSGPLYSVDAPLLSVRQGQFRACQVTLTSSPPAGCSGVAVTGEVTLDELPGVTRYRNGTVTTAPVHLVGHWDGHTLTLTEPPTAAGRTTPDQHPDCPAPTSAGERLSARIAADGASLRRGGIPLITVGACGGTAAVEVPVADHSTVTTLSSRYGPVLVYGWLIRAATDAGSPTDEPAPQAVRDAAERLRSGVVAYAPVTGVWVTMTWGEWQRLASSNDGAGHESTHVYVIQLRSNTEMTCQSCKGPVNGRSPSGRFATVVVPQDAGDSGGVFIVGNNDFGLSSRPDAHTFPDPALPTAAEKAAAGALCRSALGSTAVAWSPTTVGEARSYEVGGPPPTTAEQEAARLPARGAWPASTATDPAAWCTTGSHGSYTFYAAGPDGTAVRIESVGGFGDTPPDRPAAIP